MCRAPPSRCVGSWLDCNCVCTASVPLMRCLACRGCWTTCRDKGPHCLSRRSYCLSVLPHVPQVLDDLPDKIRKRITIEADPAHR